MKRIAFLCMCLLWCTTFVSTAQTSEPVRSSRFTFRLMRLVTKYGTAREGWFLGTIRDSVVIQAGGRSDRISRTDLLRVVIDTEPQKGGPVLVGMLAGMYVGNVMLKADNQPTQFRERDDSPFLTLLYQSLFSLAGGGIGYLVGASRSDEVTFDFSGSEAENASLWNQLCEGSTDAPHTPFHLSLQGSWVWGPLPQPGEASYYSFKDATSLNMLRKVQLTYSMSGFADVGLAVVWLGQPSYQFYTYAEQYTNSKSDFSGTGYYAIGVIQPLWRLGWRDVQWDIGVGVGMASVDFRAASQTYDYIAASEIAVGKKTKAFSALITTELRVFVTDYLSVGLAADLVYIPEDVPAVQGFKFESKTLGTRSAGFVLGLHL